MHAAASSSRYGRFARQSVTARVARTFALSMAEEKFMESRRDVKASGRGSREANRRENPREFSVRHVIHASDVSRETSDEFPKLRKLSLDVALLLTRM